MATLYPRWSNPLYRALLLTLSISPGFVIGGLMIYVRTPYNTRAGLAVEQPVQFDHRHHVLDDRIPCLYCHAGAETEASAGVPSARVCMGCHAQIWNDSPLLEAVRRANFQQRPIAWRRVHDLADFVYFHHGVHVQAGIDCSACHGDVAGMSKVYRQQALQMGFCIDCHRKAEERLVAHPDERVPQVAWNDAGREASTAGGRLPGALTTCTACHR